MSEPIIEPNSVAEISFDPFPAEPAPDEQAGPVHSDEFGPAFTRDYELASRYENKSGILARPVAGPPGTPPEIIVVHAGMRERVVKFSGERNGAWPKIPEPVSNAEQVLVYDTLLPEAPRMGPEGNRIHRLSGVHVYVLLSDPAAFQAGRPPYDLQAAGLNTVTASQYDPGIFG